MRGTDGQTTHVMNAGLVPLAARTPALVAAAGAACRDLQHLSIDELQTIIRDLNAQRAAVAKDGT